MAVGISSESRYQIALGCRRREGSDKVRIKREARLLFQTPEEGEGERREARGGVQMGDGLDVLVAAEEKRFILRRMQRCRFF